MTREAVWRRAGLPRYTGAMKWMCRVLGMVLAAVLLAGCRVRDGVVGGGRTAGLDEAWRILSGRRFVDLTHAFGPDTPVWQGFGQARFDAASDPATGRPYAIAGDGFRATQYTMVGQYGTHVDAPAHFDPDGVTLDRMSVTNMVLPLVVFDLTPVLAADPAHAFGVADLEAWERVHGRVPAGCFAALRTDMSRDWESAPARFMRQPFPAWSPEAVRLLFERRGVVAIGHESMDTDTTSDLQSETWLLRHGHWQVEVMANLDQVPATGALIVVAWPKPRGGVGFPVRAFAILP